MTTENRAAETERESSGSFENIKTLSALAQSNELALLQKNIREGKKIVDAISKDIKEAERQRAELLRQERARIEAEEQEKLNAENAKIALEQAAAIALEHPEIVVSVAQTDTEPAPVVAPPPVEDKKPAPQNQRTRQFTDSGRPQYDRQGGFQPRNNNPNYTPRPFNQQGQQQKPFNNQQGAGGARFQKPASSFTAPNITNKSPQKSFDKKKDGQKQGDDKKTMNKRTLIRKGFITEDTEERMGTRKFKNKKVREQVVAPPIKIEKAVITTENLTVKLLSEKIGKPATEIIKMLMTLDIMTTINSVVDFKTMELVANEFGVELELKLDKTKEEVLEELHLYNEDEGVFSKRPPIVTIMGHVDHGKTSLLDAIKKTNIALGEAGGITQHIGAYSVSLKGEKITFIDTPGHEAFTAMRARGAKITDIAIIVVAADDGIMPQTVEAINHAKAANVQIIIAVNKMDKAGASTEKVMQKLTEFGLIAEEWGGDTIVVPVSAKTGMGIDKLLESILITAEIMELKACENHKAKGVIIEARLDKGKGPVATVIIQNGTLFVGDTAVSGTTYGRIRAMHDDKGRLIKEAGPSVAVSVIGFTEVPNAGDLIYVVADEKLAKQVADERSNKYKSGQVEISQTVSLDEVFNKISEGQIKGLNIIVKADTHGSVEALKESLLKLSNDEIKINTIHGGVGAINKSDVMLAEASGAIIIGFNVRADNDTKQYAESNKIDIRLYRIIYEALDDIEAAVKGMLTPKFREQILGHAEVRNTFKITGAGTIAGLMVQSGKIVRNAKVRVLRDNVVIFEGNISSLKRFKDDVKEVGANYECGLSIEGFNDIKELDKIEAFVLEQIK